MLSASGCSGNNGTKTTPTLTADLLGDWREELIGRESNNTGLRVYTTTDVTTRRIYTLMHDPTYRMQVSFEQSSYNQPPHTGFHIGSGMAEPPEPRHPREVGEGAEGEEGAEGGGQGDDQARAFPRNFLARLPIALA